MLINSESQQVVGLELKPGYPINGYFGVSLGEQGYVPAHDVPFNELVLFDGTFDRPPMIWYPSTNSVGDTIARSPNGAGFGVFESRRNTSNSVSRNDVPGILLARATFTGVITRVPITNSEITRKLNFNMLEAKNLAQGPGLPSKIKYCPVPTMIRGSWFLGSDARTYQTMDPSDLQFGYEYIDYLDEVGELQSMSFAMLYFFIAQKASTKTPVKNKYFYLDQVIDSQLPFSQKEGEEDANYLARLHRPLRIPGAPSLPTCFVTFQMDFDGDGLPRLPASSLVSSGYPSGSMFSVTVASATSAVVKELKTFTSGNGANWPTASLLPLPAVRLLHQDGYDMPFPKGGATEPTQIIR